MTPPSLIGQSIVKPDARDKALGRTRYGVDLKPGGALVAKVLRSPHPHARILRIDVSKAKQLPGVVAVVTAQDTPAVHYGRWVHDRTIFARDKVRHVGEPVAAVAAVDEDTAEEALELISVDYEQLPAVVAPPNGAGTDGHCQRRVPGGGGASHNATPDTRPHRRGPEQALNGRQASAWRPVAHMSDPSDGTAVLWCCSGFCQRGA